MAREFKETAHLKTDLDKYGEGYDRIFKKKDDWIDFSTITDDELKELNESLSATGKRIMEIANSSAETDQPCQSSLSPVNSDIGSAVGE